MTSRILRPLVLNSKQITPRPSIQYPAAIRFLSSATVKMADRVHRVTMFKLPSEESQKKLVELYQTLKANNSKVN